MAAACAGQQTLVSPESDGEPLGAKLPPWIANVYPGPGASMASISAVEVVHQVRGPQEGVRLELDGVDVTAAARVGPGRLHYDPERAASVRLDSGKHTAEVKRVRRSGFGEPMEVVDSFRWRFAVR